VHELSLSSAIVQTALRHADGRRVKSVQLRIGALRQVVPDSLDFYFEIVARDTLCEGAALECEHVAALLRCPGCDERWDPAPPPLATHEPPTPEGVPALPTFRCPRCRTGGEVVHGDEFQVESIEVEQGAEAPKEDECIAPR
jgi:hydrogenase nickel incorporation protein HypA/HybF